MTPIQIPEGILKQLLGVAPADTSVDKAQGNGFAAIFAESDGQSEGTDTLPQPIVAPVTVQAEGEEAAADPGFAAETQGLQGVDLPVPAQISAGLNRPLANADAAPPEIARAPDPGIDVVPPAPATPADQRPLQPAPWNVAEAERSVPAGGQFPAAPYLPAQIGSEPSILPGPTPVDVPATLSQSTVTPEVTAVAGRVTPELPQPSGLLPTPPTVPSLAGAASAPPIDPGPSVQTNRPQVTSPASVPQIAQELPPASALPPVPGLRSDLPAAPALQSVAEPDTGSPALVVPSGPVSFGSIGTPDQVAAPKAAPLSQDNLQAPAPLPTQPALAGPGTPPVVLPTSAEQVRAAPAAVLQAPQDLRVELIQRPAPLPAAQPKTTAAPAALPDQIAPMSTLASEASVQRPTAGPDVQARPEAPAQPPADQPRSAPPGLPVSPGDVVPVTAAPTGPPAVVVPSEAAAQLDLVAPQGVGPSGEAARALPTAAPSTVATAAPPVSVQLAQAIATHPGDMVELTLHPEELGKVRLSLSPTENAITVGVMAERAETADLIRRHLDQLSQDLRQQGYRDVRFDFGQGSQDRPPQHDRPASDGSGPASAAETVATPPPAPLRLGASTGVDIRI